MPYQHYRHTSRVEDLGLLYLLATVAAGHSISNSAIMGSLLACQALFCWRRRTDSLDVGPSHEPGGGNWAAN